MREIQRGGKTRRDITAFGLPANARWINAFINRKILRLQQLSGFRKILWYGFVNFSSSPGSREV
jgi:hypothetical protein